MNILNSIHPRPLPDTPTTHPPGTDAKEAVMCVRLKELTQLHHPADARYPGDLLPLQWMRWKKQQRAAALAAATRRIFDKIKAKKKLENPRESESF